MKADCNEIAKARLDASKSFVASFLIRESLAAAPQADEDCSSSKSIALEPMAPFNPFPYEGQVRLLSQVEQITYVLLARRWGDDAFLVIPFSQYAVPATDLELRLQGNAGAHLQVLQIWNARTLQAETLRKTWLIGKMNSRNLEDALGLWEYSVGGKPPNADVLARTGVPISRGDDPRIRYQDDVLQEFAQLDADDLARAEKGESSKRMPVIVPVWSPVQCLAAGERQTSTVRRSTCRIKGFAGELEIVYSVARKCLSLEVFDTTGETSSALDGWHFFYHDGTDFGVIAAGRVIADGVEECNGACCLLDAEGAVRVLMPPKGEVNK